jgi:tRNA(Ile)-lysidine synthase
MNAISRVRTTIRQHELIRPGQHVLVAVSGGADSVGLLHILNALARTLRIRLTLAHLNHGIRGATARTDESFVKHLARGLKLRCICGHSDVPRCARVSGVSLEMAAREARYRFLSRTAKRVGADLTATAHTADDQAETVLLKLARGAGPGGLTGIRYRIGIMGTVVVRPLLDTRRAELRCYLESGEIAWREDESNRNPAFLRNRVRRDVLPFLEEKLNPRIVTALIKTANVSREEDAWLDVIARTLLEECRSPRKKQSISVPLLGKHGVAARRRVIRLWLAGAGMDPDSIDFSAVERVDALVCNSRRTTGAVQVPGLLRAVRQYDVLSLKSGGKGTPARFRRLRVKIPGETIVTDAGLRIVASLRPGIIRERPAGAGSLPSKASVSLAAIGRKGVFVRSWRKGDRMRPLGLKGSRKIQDILVDAKVPGEQRGLVPLFECGSDIIWLPGYRIASGCEVSDNHVPALQLAVERIR